MSLLGPTYGYIGVTVAITGAGSGIGRALALDLASRGVSGLALSDINEATCMETLQLIDNVSKNVKTTVHRIDVSNTDDMESWRDSILADFGEVHYIINNAGLFSNGAIIPSKRSENDLHAIQTQWQRAFDVNFQGVVNGTRAFVPVFMKQSRGCVVNIASINAIWTWAEHTGYTASKHAVKGFTESLMIEMFVKAPHIQISCVFPGGVKTNICRNALFTKNEEERKDWFSRRFEEEAQLTPEGAASWILNAVGRGKTRILVGYDALVLDFAMRVAPVTTYNMYKVLGRELSRSNQKVDRISDLDDAKLSPFALARLFIGGGWWFGIVEVSAHHPITTGACVTAIVGGSITWLWSKSKG